MEFCLGQRLCCLRPSLCFCFCSSLSSLRLSCCIVVLLVCSSGSCASASLSFFFLPFPQLSVHCLFLFVPHSDSQLFPAALSPLAPSLSTFWLSPPTPSHCHDAAAVRGWGGGAIYLSETGSANLNHLSPAAGNYLEVGTGPGNCCLHRPAAQGLLLHASPCRGSLGAMPRM